MKVTKRKFALTIDRTRSIRISKPSSDLVRCAECGSDAAMLSPEIAANLAGLTPRSIYRLVEECRIHFRESLTGELLVCLYSLMQMERLNEKEYSPDLYIDTILR